MVALLHPGVLWLLGFLGAAERWLVPLVPLEVRERLAGLATLDARRLLERLRFGLNPLLVVAVLALPNLVMPYLVATAAEPVASAHQPLGRPSGDLSSPPAGMVTVPLPGGRRLATDADEAHDPRTGVPVTGLTPAEAEAWCRHAGKHLCTSGEWYRACAGPHDRRYILGPNGASLAALREVRRACNVGGGDHPRALLPVGTLSRCTSELGLRDLTGNAFEWVALPSRPGFWGLAGSYFGYSDDQTLSCGFRALVHEAQLPVVDLGVIGFRCCF